MTYDFSLAVAKDLREPLTGLEDLPNRLLIPTYMEHSGIFIEEHI
jgi:hypothetical protein